MKRLKVPSIHIRKAKNKDTKTISEDIPNWLKSYGVSVINSNGKLRIVVRDFDKDFSKLEDAFPNLSFASFDEETRTITAKEK